MRLRTRNMKLPRGNEVQHQLLFSSCLRAGLHPPVNAERLFFREDLICRRCLYLPFIPSGDAAG